jgi:hypothetical protein
MIVVNIFSAFTPVISFIFGSLIPSGEKELGRKIKDAASIVDTYGEDIARIALLNLGVCGIYLNSYYFEF